MPLGTINHSPPPFFRQGLSALSKLLLCAALAIVLMAADRRFALTGPLRNLMATALLPVVEVLRLPMVAWDSSADYLNGISAMQRRIDALERRLAIQALQSTRAEQLTQENQRLRELLTLRPALKVQQHAAEVLYEAADPYSHKIFIDRGSQAGIQAGAPVVTEAGVLGQVTRTYLLTAEVTLLVDKDAAIPVLNARTQHRSAAFGSGEEGLMELRFVAAADDVKPGDLLTTSGVDGIYPSGLPVAKVMQVDRRGDAGFARISLAPTAAAAGVHHVLVLDPTQNQLAPRTEAAVNPSEQGKGYGSRNEGRPDANGNPQPGSTRAPSSAASKAAAASASAANVANAASASKGARP